MGSIYLATLRNPALVASYQTSPGNLYGTPFATGMENYFQKIKTHFGQSMFDQLVTEFAQQSNLYVDEIKVDEWHIYGSSRLGVYEANRTISKRIARDLNNDNQITNNEYVIETPEEVLFLYSSYQLERGAKRYELANHLGNVLTVISDKKTANFTGTTFSNFTAERISATDYSPFGAPLAGRTWNGGEYRFGFNTMEKDNEINGAGNAYDFGARIYDSRLGRWMSVDPLQVDYQFISPYSFCLNSPITSVDPDGKKVVVVRKPNQGKEGRDLVLITIDAKWIDKSGKIEALRAQQQKVEEINDKESRKYKRQNKKLERMTLEYNAYAQREMEELKNSIESTFQGMDEHTEWKTEVNISDGSFYEIKNTDHAFYAVIEVKDAAARANILGGLVVYYSPGYVEGYSSTKVKTHETGHFLGLLHCYENFFNGKRATEYNKQFSSNDNLTSAFGISPENLLGQSPNGTIVDTKQLSKIEDLFNQGCLNRGNNKFDTEHGKNEKHEPEGYQINYTKP